MTLEGAINFNETESYIIYTMNSVTTGQYGVVMPKNITGTLNMLVDLHMKGSFDSVGSGAKTKEQLVGEISEEYNNLKAKYVDGMLVIPMIDEGMFKNAVMNNDKQKMFDEVKKIGAITSELYKKLTDSGIEKQKIDQKIIIVQKNEDDEKFVGWLKEQMPNFVDGIRYSELVAAPVQEVVNPFVASNDIFGPAPVSTPSVETPVAPVADTATVSAPVSSGSIFDNPASVVPEAPVVTEPVVETPVVESSVTAPVVEEQPVVSAGTDIFGTPAVAPEPVVASQPVNNVASVETTTVSEPVASVAAEPKPVSSAALEGTIAFTPIPNHPNNPVESEEETGQDTRTASKGFANLIILLVILVGVTIVSIELGKFLYSVYGA